MTPGEVVDGWEERGAAGVAVVAHAGETTLHRAFGLADREAGTPVRPEMGFDIGSITKLHTAAAVLELAAAGNLRLDDELSRFFPAAPPDKAHITLDQVLRHTSGLADLVGPGGSVVTDYDVDAFDYALVSRDEFVHRTLASPLRSRPGERNEYSNAGYGLLGAVIEVVSGTPYESFVRGHVLLPAGLERTGYLEPQWDRADLAVGYRDGERWGTPLDHPWLDDGPSWNLRAAGGFISTAADLAQWMTALERGAALTDAARATYLDLFVGESRRGTRAHGFGGSNGIFDAYAAWDLDLQCVIAAVASIAEHSALEIGREVTAAVIEELGG